MEGVMKKLLLIVMAAVAVASAAAGSRVSVKFRNCDDPAMRGLLGALGGYQITATVHADGIDARFYEMWLVKSDEGKLSRKLFGFAPVRPDSTEFCFTAVTVDSMNVWLSVEPCGGRRVKLSIPTVSSLLIECERPDGYAPGDTIQLMAFSPGRATEFDLGNGKKVTAYDICGVRNACISPAEWYSRFNIPLLYYVEAVPVSRVDYSKLSAE